MTKKPGFMLYGEWENFFTLLSATAVKELIQVLFIYYRTEEEPTIKNPKVKAVWDVLRSRMDRDTERYERVAELRRNAANVRWERERQNGGEGEPRESLQQNADKKLEKYMQW